MRLEKISIPVIDSYADALDSRSLGQPDRDRLLEESARYMRYMIRRIASLESRLS